MQVQQILLSHKPTSGRGVRFKLLTPSQRDGVLLRAATIAGPNADRTSMALASSREGAKSMLVAVTTGPVADIGTLPGAVWHRLTKEELEDLTCEYAYDKIFTAKDDELLCGIYQKMHGASAADVEAIAGEAQTVSLD